MSPTDAPTDRSSISRLGPSSVTYTMPTTPSMLKTTINLPAHSTWTSGLHWHNNSTEYLRLVQGSIFVTLGKETSIYRLEEGGDMLVTIDPGVRHNWGRAENYLQEKARELGLRDGGIKLEGENKYLGEEVVVEEWTAPSSINKPLFFWNLNGVVNAPSSTTPSVLQRSLGSYWVPFQLFVIFYKLDNYPVLVNMYGRLWWFEGFGQEVARRLEAWIEHLVTFVVLFAASVLGRVAGVEAVSEGRTPKALWEASVKNMEKESSSTRHIKEE